MFLQLLSGYCTRRTCLTIFDSGKYLSHKGCLTQRSTAQKSLAKLEMMLVLVGTSNSIRSSVATYDGNCAAASLLSLSGTDVDEVLCAGRSGRGWKELMSVHMVMRDEETDCLRLAQFKSASPRTSVAQHWMLLYVPLQMRAA
jgi:hypothetical protein